MSDGCGFCFQAEDGIRDLVRSRGLGDVYKRQGGRGAGGREKANGSVFGTRIRGRLEGADRARAQGCLLYTSDAADERSRVDLGGRRIIKKKKYIITSMDRTDVREYDE